MSRGTTVAIVTGGVGLLCLGIVAAVGVVVGAGPLAGTRVSTVDAATRERVAADVEALAAELDDWWDDALRPHRSGLPMPRIADGTNGLRCDGDRIRLDETLVDNAWAGGCDEGLTVAYDPALLAVDTVELELTLAHEWGHLAQFMTPQIALGHADDELPVESELQADCFAGAWYGAARSEAPLEPAVASVRASGDEPGTPRDDPEAHGSGDERVEAFLAGHAGGLDACVP